MVNRTASTLTAHGDNQAIPVFSNLDRCILGELRVKGEVSCDVLISFYGLIEKFS
jgi:hypothetical protein